MSGFIDFEIVGNEHGVQRMLEHLNSALSPIGLAFFLGHEVRPWLVERVKNRMASQGDDVTGPWQPLAESTIEIRESQGFEPTPINKRTGELEDYITGSNVDIIAAQGVATLKFPGGDNRPGQAVRTKLRTAQLGREQPRTPPRPVLGVNETDLSEILTQLAFHVQEWQVI